MRITLLFLVFLLLTSALDANSVVIEINPQAMVYNYFYPSYIDPGNPESQPLLFWLTVTNTGEEDILDYEVWISFRWGEYELISNARVKPKPGSPYETILTGQSFQFTSRDIIVSDESGYFYAIEGLDLEDILDYNDEFKDRVLALGYFPDGYYVFTVQIYNVEGYPLSDPATFAFTIIAPTSITLISPGNPAGMGVSSIPDPYPYFIWFSNMIDYRIRLYELDREISDPEEIELQYEVYFEDDVYNSVVYSYPLAAPPLENNRIYGWQVLADVVTPMMTEEEELKSTINLFRISLEGGINQNDQLLMNFLQQLNVAGIEEILLLLQNGYSLDKIYWQGEEHAIDILNDLLNQISSGQRTVTNITVE
ncbi:MAG: hypothetical protein JXB60_10125 [Candidatus Cloacimonetes bacterium]|nr:hypothetical protein [Candidatus Cloacimonadota bacterium]